MKENQNGDSTRYRPGYKASWLGPSKWQQKTQKNIFSRIFPGFFLQKMQLYSDGLRLIRSFHLAHQTPKKFGKRFFDPPQTPPFWGVGRGGRCCSSNFGTLEFWNFEILKFGGLLRRFYAERTTAKCPVSVTHVFPGGRFPYLKFGRLIGSFYGPHRNRIVISQILGLWNFEILRFWNLRD